MANNHLSVVGGFTLGLEGMTTNLDGGVELNLPRKISESLYESPELSQGQRIMDEWWREEGGWGGMVEGNTKNNEIEGRV